ncbi:MAG: hypothetical protein WCK02_17415 [Bacteroidota bacterium]
MAKQVGHIKYNGTLGDVRHFKIKGLEGDFAGLKGGPSGEQIKNAPEFQRTRENNSEFGGSAIAGKSVRVGLSSLLTTMSDSRLTSRLTSIFKQINIKATSGIRGQRPITLSTNKNLLNGLEFNNNTAFAGICNVPFSMTNVASRTGATISISGFTPVTNINAPIGATHFRLIGAISVVSDYIYDSATKKYLPTSPALNGLNNVSYSSYFDLNQAITGTTTITTALPGSPTMTTDTSVLSCIGIEFYQKVGLNYYTFSANNALKIGSIF